MSKCKCGDYLGTLGSNSSFTLPEYYWNIRSPEQRVYLICRRIEELDSEIEQNKADIATNKAAIETNKASIATNKEGIEANKAAIEELDATVAQLQTELTEKYKELKALCDKLQEEIDAGATYKLPVATDTVLGGVKIGDNLSITDEGVLSATGGGGSGYTLPVATSASLGGVKIGDGLSIDENGKLSMASDLWGTAIGSFSYVKEVVTINEITERYNKSFRYYTFHMFAAGDSFTIPAHGSVAQDIDSIATSSLWKMFGSTFAVKAFSQDAKAVHFNAYLCKDANGLYIRFTNDSDEAITIDSSTYSAGELTASFMIPASVAVITTN